MSAALRLPEVTHMLNTLLGSLSALEEHLKEARRYKDPSIIRIAVSEAENASKVCVRLSQALSSFAAQNPGEVHKNLPPAPKDTELEAMAQEFLDILSPLKDHIREQTIVQHVDALSSGGWRESDYQRSRDHVRTPMGDSLSIADWLTVLSHTRELTEAEQADLKNLQEN